ncbi:MAG: efflux RND transporter periplasmic adaptor subunit [Gloeobacterales cyanobacterium]
MTEVTSESPTKERFRLKLPPHKVWWSIAGIALVLAGGIWTTQHFSQSSPDNKTTQRTTVVPLAVETLTVRLKKLPDRLELSGTIQPVDSAVLSTRVMGRIKTLALQEGDRVKKGQVLAQIDVADIAAQSAQAQAGVGQSQAGLAQTKANLNQLKSQQVEARASLKLAKINQSRTAQLRNEGAISQSQLDQANTALDVAQAKVAQIESAIRQGEAAITQSQAAIAQAKAGVGATSANISYGVIRAPFDGVVIQKLAYEGEMTTPGSSLLKLENTNHLRLEVAVPEADLRFIRLDQSVVVKIDALEEKQTATVKQIVPAADPNSRSFIVKVPLKNSGHLISGMFGRIELPRGTREVIMIPVAALVRRGQLEGVYVVDANNQAVLRWVKTASVRDNQIEIASGLTDGDRIIISHLQQLSDGQSITLRD